MSEPRFTIYAADRGGSSWTVCQHDDARLVLEVLAVERAAYGRERCYGVYETDNPEWGDVETRLIEAQEDVA